MSASEFDGQLDLFPPFTVTRANSRRFIVRTLEDGRGIKPGEKKGTAQLPIEVISTGAGNKMTGQVGAKGTCTFANPYAGKPVAIECSAKSTELSFAASFLSNGKPPHGK